MNKKFYLLPVVLTAMCVPGKAAAATETDSPNYFTEGTSWLYHVDNVYLPDRYVDDVTVAVEAPLQIAGYQANEVWKSSAVKGERELVSYVRTEGDKVYFLADETSSDWRLIYDFSLQPGETTVVWSPEAIKGYPLAAVTLRCEEIRVCATDPTITEMVMTNPKWDDLADDVREDMNIVWFKGLGNNGNPFFADYSEAYAGIGFELLDVSVNGTSRYRSPGYAAVGSVADSSIDIEVSKGRIAVNGSDAHVYGIDGIEIVGSDGVYDSLTPGIYVVTCGGKSQRVSVR